MLIRFIVYSVIAYFVIRFIRNLMTKQPAKATPRRSAPTRGTQSAVMVRCAACGTFVTETSALAAGGGKYCSTACAKSRVRTA